MLDQPTSYSQAELGVPEARREEPRGMDWGYFHHEQNATPLYSMSYVIISTPTSDRLTSSGAALALVFGNLPLGREARTGRNGSAAAGHVRCSPASAVLQRTDRSSHDSRSCARPRQRPYFL